MPKGLAAGQSGSTGSVFGLHFGIEYWLLCTRRRVGDVAEGGLESFSMLDEAEKVWKGFLRGKE